MNLHDAAALARGLMDQHGLEEWSLRFNRGRRMLGVCRYEQKRIELSVHFVQANDDQAVRDTVLHEIAHALAGHAAGHGPAWKQVCRRIGAKPERCSREAAMPAGRWKGVCPGCKTQFTRHRRPLRGRRYSCRRCGPEKGPIKFRLAQEPPR